MNFGFRLTVFFALAGLLMASGPGPSGASTRQVSLKIPNEAAPPDGVVQMKFMVTEPTPISSGRPAFGFDATTFDAVWGIELFCPTGDVNGMALINGSRVNLFYITSSGAQGTDYPIMSVALHVRPDAPFGSQTQFGLDPTSTWILGLLGGASLKPVPPALVTVAGTISITNVVPGGGLQPAGTVIRVKGIGFQPKTQIQLNQIKASSIAVVSPEEIQITLAEAINMTGQKIQVVNPDGSQDTYFSYMRGIPLGQSSRALLAHAVPIFSSMKYSTALFAPIAVAAGTQFVGLALQNPNQQPVSVHLSLVSAANSSLATVTINLPGSYHLTRQMSELFGGVLPPPGSYIKISASKPVQMFGFLGDDSTGTFSPFTAVSTQP